MEAVKPYSGNNAVKVIALGIDFSKRLSDEKIEILIKELNGSDLFKGEFSDIKNQEEFSMTIGPDGVQNQTQLMAGIVFIKTDENKLPIWSLTINKNALIVQCRNYTRWKYVSPQLYKYIDESFSLIKEEFHN